MSPPLPSRIFIAYFAVQSVIAYENAYDLLERRNQKFYEPRYFQSTTFYDDRNRFFTHNQNPQLGYTTDTAYYSKFGNGYDNLGNGIPPAHFRPFRQQMMGGWRLQRRPLRERNFNHLNFHDYSSFRRPQQEFVSHLSGGYYPTFHETPALIPHIYGDDVRGSTDFSKADRFFENSEDNKQNTEDQYYQRTQEGTNADYLTKEKMGEQVHSDQLGENKSSLRSNKVVKKGRTTKGFAIHHHKDETGNSTTFFDESSDFGGQSDLRDISDEFGTRRTLEQITHKGDEKYFKENDGKTASHGRGLLVGNQRSEKDYSSTSGHEESAKKYLTGNENDLGLKKTYQYLNGERFEYTEPQVDNYY